MMAYIYSGFDRVTVGSLKMWSSEDEALIEKWLAE